ncbi:hypothetical protein [Chondromyces apiculatus]|uniref:Uncharacterized protein n=1 Tax=Chondromyces apiculatus DSM 436 TaxID=1192034 RepID=A0A017T3U3_9BACT|nr:hypothetical protein [Chondromyces apiculatus]EYF03231.1 Hypothetical protein CAP_5735 [Chondromyces apiculatus DSM 436]
MSSGRASYSVVEATPGWVAGRLEALAGDLMLPCPVRDGFLFRADEEFYEACTGSVVSLQQAARKVIEHLGLACGAVVVGFRSGVEHAGSIQRKGGDWFIEISERFRGDGYAIGAVLAHECCHILLVERGVGEMGSAVDEVHVDLAVMLTGLGALTLNAITERTRFGEGQAVRVYQSLGYLSIGMLEYAYAYVADALGVGRERALRDLSDSARGSVRFLLVERAMGRVMGRERGLAYQGLGSHVVVPCVGECRQRLRVPAGAVGKVRCPECGHARGFDGRGCVVAARGERVKMVRVGVPELTALYRVRVFLGSLSLPEKVVYLALVAAIGWFGSSPLRGLH